MVGGSAPTSWEPLIKSLIDLRGQSRTWTLSEAARSSFELLRTDWKRQARGIESSAGVSAALDKADRHLLRIALVLAEADAPGQKGQVSDRVIQRAAAIVQFTINCWRALPEQGGLGPSRRDEKLASAVDRVRDWIEEHGGHATRRELQRARAAGIRKGTELDATLTAYEETWPGTITEERPPGGGLKTLVIRAPQRRP